MQFAAAQDMGSRQYQEDDYRLLDLDSHSSDAGNNEYALLVLADGMGGQVGGEVASGLITEAVVHRYQSLSGFPIDRLRDCLFTANVAVREKVQSKPELEGMGATLVAAAISESGLEWVSVGDSPMWLYRLGSFHRLNEDHSMAPVIDEMIASGRLDPEEVKLRYSRNALRSAVYGGEINLIDQSKQPVPMHQDDLLILASDGLETLSVSEICELIKARDTEPLQVICDALIEAVKSKQNPNQDNLTVLILKRGEIFDQIRGDSNAESKVTSDDEEHSRKSALGRIISRFRD